MRQDNATDGRKLWSTARERERLRARFQIRERVSKAECPPITNPTDSLELTKADADFLSQCITYIQTGDRSKFSLSSMDRHIHLFSSNIPTNYLRESLPQTIQLSTAWFGHEYARSLVNYIESLDSFTLVEYAAWMGKNSILGSLLIGGVNPCLRSSHRKKDGDDDDDDDDVQWWQRRMAQIGSQVLKRFFYCFPLPLETHIVKRVVEMRMWAYDQQEDANITCKCKYHMSDLNRLPLDFRLTFSPCQHTFCEPCFWEDLLRHIDQRGDEDDVVLCPICGVAGTGTGGTLAQQAKDFRHLTPVERCQESLTRFRSLPINRQALKSKPEKKKKVSEKEHIAPSWYASVLPSTGSTQDVRKDKFFSYIERNAIHYMRGCLIGGVDVTWKNEYGQTALYICAWRGYAQMAELLLDYGANPYVPANGGSTIPSICGVRCHARVMEVLERHNYSPETLSEITYDLPVQTTLAGAKQQESESDFSLTTLIPRTSDHPGAGSYFVDNAFSSDQVKCLLSLHSLLPVNTTQKKKTTSLCSERSYYCDAEGHIRKMLQNVTANVGLVSNPDTVKAFPYMRFLHYSQAGAILAPHVDLCRVDPCSECRSTHTFIIYLTNCEIGGETCLLGNVAGEGRSEVLACVAPKRGRLLLFPHACPHEGKEVCDVPKILLRGEIMIPSQPQ